MPRTTTKYNSALKRFANCFKVGLTNFAVMAGGGGEATKRKEAGRKRGKIISVKARLQSSLDSIKSAKNFPRAFQANSILCIDLFFVVNFIAEKKK